MLSMVSSIILGVILIRQKNKEHQEYRGNVDKAMERLRKETQKEVKQ